MEKYGSQQALARSRIYQLLSAAFLYPDEEFFSLMHQDSFTEDLKGCSEFLAEGPKSGFLEKLEEGEEVFKVISLEELKTEYGRVFGHSICRDYPSYETEYGPRHVFQQTQNLADLAGFYRAFGLEVSQKQGERLDHIAVELEFMGFLAYKEYYASKNHGEDKAQICRDAQEKFLKENLGRWAPIFFKLLKKRVTKGFYYRIGAITDAFLSMEMRLFKVHPQPIEEIQPQEYKDDDTYVSCINSLENP
jgi:DMSO reductase family type II enzyme chaperone